MDSRTKRQYGILDKWEKNNYIGTAECVTGFGKTYMAILAIQGMIKRKGISKVTIIVPTKDLKDQWQEELIKNKVQSICTVMVVNSGAKYYDVLSCDLLIIDEYHTVAPPYFRKVLDIQYKYLFTLTATIKRTDGLHDILLKHSPIIDTVTLEEALRNKWVAEFIIYNIPVDLNFDDLDEYNKITTRFKGIAAKVGGMQNAKLMLKSPIREEAGLAAAYYKCIRKRKDICMNNYNKVDIVKRIVDCFPNTYGLIFNPSIDFSKKIESELGKKCMSYHSKLSKVKRTEVIKKFKDNRTSVRLLSTVSALDAGFNHPKSSLGIITAGNSSSLTNIQRTGRLVRKHPDKQAIIVNLYSPDTQEVSWLNTRLNGMKTVWLNSIEDFEMIYKT